MLLQITSLLLPISKTLPAVHDSDLLCADLPPGSGISKAKKFSVFRRDTGLPDRQSCDFAVYRFRVPLIN
jgi:hypothetical protein